MLRLAAALALTGAIAAGAASGAEFDAATGYRTDRYRAPVDRPVEGGRQVSLGEVDRLVAEDRAALIDVMPVRAGYDPLTGRWLLMEPRRNIPGSVWLPEVGRGALDATIAGYFRGALARLTAERPERPLVFYCMADCWMSWNAVKRAASLGYRNLYWYAEGSDGWRDADRALADGDPWPLETAGGASAVTRREPAR
ncbi:rhodanese-like domain-containing protein [Methylopila sp. M107]|uniref:rhodanese-like domain-containing protein n=1 Tax=Methylopila sp. M107 TaxID=1101190 RepID=UPI00037032CF|nr:rhodanese-like domain-containing protein [Methylopila sp. M107]